MGELMTLWKYYTYQKGTCLDTVEKFYIYKEAAKGNKLDDKYTITPSEIFGGILKGEGHLTDTSTSRYTSFTHVSRQ